MFTISVLNRDHLFEEYKTDLSDLEMIKYRNEFIDKYKLSNFHLQGGHAQVFISNGYIMTVTYK